MDEIEFHPDAQVEYLEALVWYNEQSPRAAKRFENEVARNLRSIARSPNLFPTCGRNHRLALLNRFPYQIIFRFRPGQILVTAVAHSRRAPGYWRTRT